MAAKKKLRKGRVKVEGLSALQRVLDDMPADLRRKIRPAVQETTDAVEATARASAPEDEGGLKRAIAQQRAGEQGRRVVGEVGIEGGGEPEEYAPVIEFGWAAHGIEAQPFMFPAAEKEKRKHTQRIRKQVVDFVAEQNRRA